MVFNSLHFIAFFAGVYALYRALPHRAQNVMLLAASYYFYGVWDWRFLSLLWGSTIIDYTCARAIARTEDAARRRAWLLLSLAFNLGMLGFFKYFNFFAGSLHDLFALLGWNLSVTTVRVILPIGISFYTFMTISYVVDVYRRVWTPTDNLLDFALYVAYFPHLVAGPILRAKKLLPQLQAPRVISAQQVREGLWLIAWGYFQKVYVADNLARVTEGVFGAGAHPTGLEVLLGRVRVRLPDLRRLRRLLEHRPWHVEADGHRAEHQLPLSVLRPVAEPVLAQLAHQPVRVAA